MNRNIATEKRIKLRNQKKIETQVFWKSSTEEERAYSEILNRIED